MHNLSNRLEHKKLFTCRKHRSHKSGKEHRDKDRGEDRHKERHRDRHRDHGSRHKDPEIQEANELRAKLGLPPLRP